MDAVITWIWNRVGRYLNEVVREGAVDAVLRFVRRFPYVCVFAPWVTGVLLLLVSYLTSYWQVTADQNNGLWIWYKANDWGFVPGSLYNKGFIRCVQLFETGGILSSAASAYALLKAIHLLARNDADQFYRAVASLCSICSGPSMLVGCIIFRTACAEIGPSFWLAFCAGLLHLPCGTIGFLVLTQ